MWKIRDTVLTFVNPDAHESSSQEKNVDLKNVDTEDGRRDGCGKCGCSGDLAPTASEVFGFQMTTGSLASDFNLVSNFLPGVVLLSRPFAGLASSVCAVRWI